MHIVPIGYYSKLGLTIITGLFGALLAVLGNFPIPWLIGSLASVSVATFLGAPLQPLPSKIERWMRVAIGVSLGPSVANSVLQNSADLVFAIVSAVLITTLFVTVGTRWFEHSTKLPKPSAFLTALPGGLSMLLAVSGDTSNRAQIVIAHTIRVVFVVASISLLARFLGIPTDPNPFVASFEWANGTSLIGLLALIVACYFLAEKLKWPGVHVILPMMICALLTGLTDITIEAPEIVKTVALFVFGLVLGHEVASGPRHSYKMLAGASIVFTIGALVSAALLALGLSVVIDKGFLVLFLAFAPGGIAEVSLIALALGLDAGLVALVHACRFIFIILAGPLGLNYLARTFKSRS